MRDRKTRCYTDFTVVLPKHYWRTQGEHVTTMSSADLGATLTKPTQRIAKHFGSAIAHEASARKERTGAQREFNIAHYYEAKQRLLNLAYRTDVDGGKDRTPSDNENGSALLTGKPSTSSAGRTASSTQTES